MKRLTALILVFLLSTSSTAMAELYVRPMTITEVYDSIDCFFAVDTEGYEWAFWEIEDWEIGDRMVAVFDDMDTETVNDDVAIVYGRDTTAQNQF